MIRTQQTLAEIAESLLPIDATWLDDHAERAIVALQSIDRKDEYSVADIADLLNSCQDFNVGLTTVRLFLDISKDEFTIRLKNELGEGGIGVQRFKSDQDAYLAALVRLGALDAMSSVTNRITVWSDILIERLKCGRGSAIKGQARGKNLEDFVERIALEVFRPDQIEMCCSFLGATGQSTAKADLAIPSANAPQILIEAKAYGATGSKQTDVLGDILKIVQEKRHDTVFLLVTDGVTWRERSSDLRKIVEKQNQGLILRIYTTSMAESLRSDLITLRDELGLAAPEEI